MKEEKSEIELGSWLIPLWARQKHFLSGESFLRDSHSNDIANQIDFDFSLFEKTNKVIKDSTQASIIARNIIINNLLEKLLNNNQDAVVINLGAGLDTKNFLYEGKVKRWYNIDLEPIINLRKNVFDEKSQNIVCNFLSFEWLKEVSERQNVIFLAEGLFMYFEKNVVSEFLTRLKKEFPGSEIIFESIGILGRNYLHPMIKNLGLKDRFKWGDSPKNIENMIGTRAENIVSTLSVEHPRWNFFRKLLNLSFGIKHLVFSTIYHFKL